MYLGLLLRSCRCIYTHDVLNETCDFGEAEKCPVTRVSRRRNSQDIETGKKIGCDLGRVLNSCSIPFFPRKRVWRNRMRCRSSFDNARDLVMPTIIPPRSNCIEIYSARTSTSTVRKNELPRPCMVIRILLADCRYFVTGNTIVTAAYLLHCKWRPVSQK